MKITKIVLALILALCMVASIVACGNSGDDKTTTTAATIKIKAIYDGSLTANYNQNAIIYFKNTLGWSDVYVNFLGEWGYWTTDMGSGNNGVTNQNKHMTQIDDTDIWYYDYGEASRRRLL